MNILEALKTGKPLRRPLERHWGATRTGYLGNQFVLELLVGDKERMVSHWYQTYSKLITSQDFFADDWEVKDDA